MEALRQPENRLKGFLPLPGGASRAKRRANPHRVKANGLRHRTGTTGHRVYANDNPVRFTDPDGRQAKESCDEVCQIKEQYERDFGKESELAKRAQDVAEGASKTADIIETGIEMAVPLPVAKLTALGKFGKFIKKLKGRGSLDDLAQAAGAADRNGLTKAGRSLQKHSSRPGSAFNTSATRASDLNAAGQSVVNDILTAPGTVQRGNRLGGVDVVAPGGQGIRFNSDGSFRGFLEP